MKDNYCVIMAGGIGSRFWPMSTVQRPKQFLDVLGIGKSLLRMTFERLLNIAPAENIYIVTNAIYKDIVKEQLPELSYDQILTEPERKNTAPCITYAAAKIHAINPNATLVVAPSDHLILKEEKFVDVIRIAIETANRNERLVTLGIKPTRPDTGYGYIEFVEDGDILPGQVKDVKHFTEKPNRELAEIFVKSGNYYWNSGIFIWRSVTILHALEKFKPELHELFTAESYKYNTAEEQAYVNHCFAACEDISIDFAVMENAKNVDVVLATFDWSDLGTWGSLYTHLEKDYNGNAVIGDNVHMINSTNCIVNLPNDKLALIEGLDNHIVVESDNMLMILNKDDEQNLKKYLIPMEEASPKFFPK
ncbi:MAG: mannose-1-phosphate guanylyltransferase [Candidatus Fluviicola riflensis]|nr:MAG: mannose-1-phosphate guanylyltransferase [Candidatus Fluviicola riflensis]OGS77418.1 MAG: mannose-1-phosphate guanylyltransferase [Candidatus Fluviicola riflensis]OGS83998.1 MAG: mannose-1-phosphate guanylyltransferase [Fluviicola sp. RIFCSPHIGHO2_12_FULL_43_24]OGS84485.1 MAG: mannose-1-phosphate guanylyltransferase [Fluviicola sp. RIFCSPHIGHO2_01_FULL_43_53]